MLEDSLLTCKEEHNEKLALHGMVPSLPLPFPPRSDILNKEKQKN